MTPDSVILAATHFMIPMVVLMTILLKVIQRYDEELYFGMRQQIDNDLSTPEVRVMLTFILALVVVGLFGNQLLVCFEFISAICKNTWETMNWRLLSI